MGTSPLQPTTRHHTQLNRHPVAAAEAQAQALAPGSTHGSNTGNGLTVFFRLRYRLRPAGAGRHPRVVASHLCERGCPGSRAPPRTRGTRGVVQRLSLNPSPTPSGEPVRMTCGTRADVPDTAVLKARTRLPLTSRNQSNSATDMHLARFQQDNRATRPRAVASVDVLATGKAQ